MSSRHNLRCWRRILSAPDVIEESGEGETPPPPGKRQGRGATPFLQVLPHSYTKSVQMIALKMQMITHWSPYILPKYLCDALKTL